jgi:hypothetical protein
VEKKAVDYKALHLAKREASVAAIDDGKGRLKVRTPSCAAYACPHQPYV